MPTADQFPEPPPLRLELSEEQAAQVEKAKPAGDSVMVFGYARRQPLTRRQWMQAMQKQPTDPRYSRLSDFAALVGCHESHASRLCQRGMPHVRVGGRVLVKMPDAVEWLDDETKREIERREAEKLQRRRNRLRPDRDKIRDRIAPAKHRELLAPLGRNGRQPTEAEVEATRAQAEAYADRLADAWLEMHARGRLSTEDRWTAHRIEKVEATAQDEERVEAMLAAMAKPEAPTVAVPKATDSAPQPKSDLNERIEAFKRRNLQREAELAEMLAGDVRVTEAPKPEPKPRPEPKAAPEPKPSATTERERLDGEIGKLMRQRPRSKEATRQLRRLRGQRSALK